MGQLGGWWAEGAHGGMEMMWRQKEAGSNGRRVSFCKWGGWGVALEDKGCVCGTGLHAEDRVVGRGEEEYSCGE